MTGILEAIENLEWFQDVNMDYIDLGDGYKIKVDYLLMDEMNLYLIFDFASENDISDFKDITLPTLKITNENNEIICDRNNLFSNQYSLYIGDKLVKNDGHHIQYLIYVYTESFPTSEVINISFSKITLSKKIQTKTEIYSPTSFSINLMDRFIERNYINYSSDNDNIEKAIITETGFYSIVSLDKSTTLKTLTIKDNNGSMYKCYNALLTSPDIEKRKYIIFSNFNNSHSDTLRLIINNNEYILSKS